MNPTLPHSFTQEEVFSFAQLSGDYNPLHIDPILARRTHFGTCVVHGIFLLLWSLESIFKKQKITSQIHQLRVRFLKPVLVGTPVLLIFNQTESHLSIRLEAEEKTAMEAHLTLKPLPPSPLPCIDNFQFPPHEAPQNYLASPQSSTTQSGEIPLFWKRDSARTLFPYLTQHTDHHTLAILAASTRIVGMKIPGEHSIYLEGTFTFLHPDVTIADCLPLEYKLAEYRQSTQRFLISIAHPRAQANLWALGRPAPVKQPPINQIKDKVSPHRFHNKKILIIGGSRGLGELAAKILAAGDAHVVLTYRNGLSDAQTVAQEINSHKQLATVERYDACDPQSLTNLLPYTSDFDHIAYFATPTIMDGDGTKISESLFKTYLDVYLHRFIHLIQWWTNKTRNPLSILYASTVAVHTPPLRQPEYAIAKAAGEAACRWLQVAHPQIKIHIAQFPRLLTDQTVSFLSAGSHDNFDTLYQELQLWIPQS